MASRPLSRISVRGLIIDVQQFLLPDFDRPDVLRACAGPSRQVGPCVSELVVGWFVDPTWMGLTFNGLREVRLSVHEGTARHFAPAAIAAFFVRHGDADGGGGAVHGLEAVKISGAGMTDLSLLENVPCISLLRDAAIAHGLADAFCVIDVHVRRSKGGRKEPVGEGEWYLESVGFVFKERTEEALRFVLA